MSLLQVNSAFGTARDHTIDAQVDAYFLGEYTDTNLPELRPIRLRASSSHWDGAKDLAWGTDVDPVREARRQTERRHRNSRHTPHFDRATRHWRSAERVAFAVESHRWTLSQFLHGEQAALLCAAKLVLAVPDIEAKHLAAAQVVDESRHVEVFRRYLDTKLGGYYPVNPAFQSLLDEVTADSRWDVTYLGMQVLVEGLALASFAAMRSRSSEPLLVALLDKVIRDEARHVAFGLTTLHTLYQGLNEGEVRDRQEFVLDAVMRMRDQLLQKDLWVRFGVPPEEADQVAAEAPDNRGYQAMLFSRIIPSCGRLGLLDGGGGWLRRRLEELGVARYERSSASMPTFEE